MIESHLDSATDGVSLAGKYHEFAVSEVVEQFRYLASEGRARSVSAVLRIVDEQTNGRKETVDFPKGVTGVVVFTVLFSFLLVAFPGFRFHRQPTGAFVFLLLDSVLIAGAWRHRATRRRAKAQLAEIRRLALETLGVIVGRPEFVPRPLTRDERKTFGRLRGTDPVGWLQVAKALARWPE